MIYRIEKLHAKTGLSWQVILETKYLGVEMFVTKKAGDFEQLQNLTALQQGNDNIKPNSNLCLQFLKVVC